MQNDLSQNIILIGNSGHAYVICDILKSNNNDIKGYLDVKEQSFNPYNIPYLGTDDQDYLKDRIGNDPYFVAIGDNKIRGLVTKKITKVIEQHPINVISRTSFISSTSSLQTGIMIGQFCVVESLVIIGEGTICSSGSMIGHEAKIGNYVIIGAGAVVGARSIIGEGSIISPNAVIAQDEIIEPYSKI